MYRSHECGTILARGTKEKRSQKTLTRGRGRSGCVERSQGWEERGPRTQRTREDCTYRPRTEFCGETFTRAGHNARRVRGGPPHGRVARKAVLL